MHRIPLGLAVLALGLALGACSYSNARAGRCCPCPCPGAPAGPMMGPEQPAAAADVEQGGAAEGAETPAPVAPTPAPAARAPVAGGRFTLAAAGLSARIPAGWKFEQNPQTVVYQASARVPSIVFFRAWGDSPTAAIEHLPSQMSAEMRSVRANRRHTHTSVAGFPALMLEGTGRIEIFPVRWRAYIIEARQRVVMVAVAPTFFWGAQQGRIQSFISGVRATAAR